jgi:hypothetical protein
MPKNKITDLRDHLFETLEALKDPDKPMEIERALAVSEVAKQIVESAKVEVAFLKATGNISGSGFVPHDQLLDPDRRRLASGEIKRQ